MLLRTHTRARTSRQKGNGAGACWGGGGCSLARWRLCLTEGGVNYGLLNLSKKKRRQKGKKVKSQRWRGSLFHRKTPGFDFQSVAFCSGGNKQGTHPNPIAAARLLIQERVLINGTVDNRVQTLQG